jgi:hypothetical protein
MNRPKALLYLYAIQREVFLACGLLVFGWALYSIQPILAIFACGWWAVLLDEVARLRLVTYSGTDAEQLIAKLDASTKEDAFGYTWYVQKDLVIVYSVDSTVYATQAIKRPG